MELEIIIIISLISLVYGVLLYILLKRQQKIDKKRILIGKKTGIRFIIKGRCWIKEENVNTIYSGFLVYKLDDVNNELEGISIAMRTEFVRDNYITLEEKEREEKKC